MRIALVSALSLFGFLGGCATMGMGHNMSQEEMMRHCQMMDQGQTGEQGEHQGMMQGGMSHEEMMRHCEMMRQQQSEAAPTQPPADPHQH